MRKCHKNIFILVAFFVFNSCVAIDEPLSPSIEIQVDPIIDESLPTPIETPVDPTIDESLPTPIEIPVDPTIDESLPTPIEIPVDLINDQDKIKINQTVIEVLDSVTFSGLRDGKEFDIYKNIVFWMVEMFGVPENRKNVNIEIGDDAEKHAYVRFQSEHKKVFLDRFNFIESQQHFIAHELFHVYYQTSAMVDKMYLSEIEGWATYAQFKFEHPNKTNAQIYDYLIQKFFLTQRDFELYKPASNDLAAYSNDEKVKAYVVNSLRLFSSPHNQVLKQYKKLTKSVGTNNKDHR